MLGAPSTALFRLVKNRVRIDKLSLELLIRHVNEGDSSKLMRLSFMVDPISFQDVRKAEGAPKADARQMIVTSWKGYTITYTAIGDVGDGWVRFTTQLTSDLGKEEAEDFRRKTEGFDFKLAQHEIDMLRWTLKDVTQEPKS